MDITGKIIAVLPKQSGTSQRTGSTWASQEYVIETHEQYPRKCCFRVFGEDKINAMNIQVGEELTVNFDIDANEYQGRWYNRLNAWKVDRVQPGENAATPAQAPAAVAPQAAPQTNLAQAAPSQPAAPDPFASESNKTDDLPF